MDTERGLLSVNDAAKRLKRSTEQVRRYLREGRLKGQRIGGQWFIDRDVLDAFAVAAQSRDNFVQRIKPAAEIRPLDDTIGIGDGPGSDIGRGKSVYRQDALHRR